MNGGWGNEPASRIIKIKNTAEANMTWNYNSTTVFGTAKRVSVQDDWLPKAVEVAAKEAIWNSYVNKRLLKFTWKVTNFRAVLSTRQSSASTAVPGGTAPAVQTLSNRPLNQWPMYYWRMTTNNQAAAPSPDAEARYTLKIMKGRSDSIWGKVPVAVNRMNGFSGTYAELLASFSKWEDYSLAFLNTGYDKNGYALDLSSQPTPDCYLLPDDPFPATWYTSLGANYAEISLVYDIETFTTWGLYKNQIKSIVPDTVTRNVDAETIVRG